MYLSRKITSLIILVVLVAFTTSCSNDNEVLEQQNPQSQISDALKQKIVSNSNNREDHDMFNNQVNWYRNLDQSSSYCGVEAALLAYELFDADNNSLNIIDIAVWAIESGLTIDDVANEIEQMAIAEFGEGVQIIFVAALLIKPIDDASFEVAEISNYATFADYFDDCQSPDVTFEVIEGTEFDFIVPEGDSVDFPDVSVPCVSLNFPLSIVVADENDISQTFEISVNEDEFLDYLQGNILNTVFINFVYPVSLTANDGTQLFANNEEELQIAFDEECTD